MSALQPEHGGDGNHALFENGDEDFALHARPLAARDVQQWLLELQAARPAVVRFEGAHHADESSRRDWTVVQVLGLGFASGVVLVLDRAQDQWHAIYYVEGGASKVWNYPMRHMLVDGDSLYATVCTSCTGWGSYADFRIDLRSHRAHALEDPDAQAMPKDRRRSLWGEERPAWVGNPDIVDIRAATGMPQSADATR